MHINSNRRVSARRNILAGPANIFTGPLWKNLLEFLFSKWYILAYFIILADGEPPKRCRARAPTPPSRWAWTSNYAPRHSSNVSKLPYFLYYLIWLIGRLQSFTFHWNAKCFPVKFLKRYRTLRFRKDRHLLLSSITPSFFHSNLKTFLFLKSYPP